MKSAALISAALLPDAAGRFAATGTHTPSLGGPEQVDRPRPSYAARYIGTLKGNGMRLTVAVPSRDLRLGPFELRRGARAALQRCL